MCWLYVYHLLHSTKVPSLPPIHQSTDNECTDKNKALPRRPSSAEKKRSRRKVHDVVIVVVCVCVCVCVCVYCKYIHCHCVCL